MISDLLAAYPLLRGLLIAIIGVGFWAIGPVIGYYVWKRYRGEGS